MIKPRPLNEVVEPLKAVARDKARESDLQHLAQRANSRPELLDVRVPASEERIGSAAGSIKHVWKDLRNNQQPTEIVHRAVAKLGARVAVFGESCTLLDGVKFTDRTEIKEQEHLIFWQMPPSAKVFQEIVTRDPGAQIYLLGADRFRL